MKKIVFVFFRRGLSACGLGPIVLALIYLILQRHSAFDNLTVNQVSIGIFSLTALAFLAGGMNVIYQVERLPLMGAILIHGVVLYLGYLGTYLLNDWLEWGTAPVLVFSGIFLVGFLAIWAIIYSIIKRKTEKLNKILKQKQKTDEENATYAEAAGRF